MFKIGEFSKISQVTVKTLRYYADIGLLVPAEVEPFTRYRYYTLEQLPRLNRIIALRDLGFSLDQIRALLEEDLNYDQLQGMFQMKQAEIERHIEEEEERLARVKARLKQIHQEGKLPPGDVILKQVEPMGVLSIREILPSYRQVGDLYYDLLRFTQEHDLKSSGPMLTLYHDLEYNSRDVDVEVALPISDDLPTEGRIRFRQLPAVEEMVSLIHQGAYPELGRSYQQIFTWVQAHDYEVIEGGRELYLFGPPDAPSPEDYVTEIQFPVRKIGDK